MTILTPTDFSNNITLFTAQFPTVLDNFIAAYGNHLKNPNDNQDNSVYSSTEGILSSLISNVFVAKNDIQNAINSYNEAIVKLNSDIIVENTRKNKLNNNLKQILGTKNGAAEMFDNTSDTYKTQYVSNIMIIIGVFLLLWMLFKVFKTPTAVIQQQY